jgi:hypothetical protein
MPIDQSDKLLQSIENIPYAQESYKVLKRFPGLKVKSIYRISEEDNEEALRDYSPMVIEFDNEYVVVIVLDEGMSNVFLIDNMGSPQRVQQILKHNKYKTYVVNNSKSEYFSEVAFDVPIQGVAIIRKDHKFSGWHVMSGISMTFCSGQCIVIGTKLTDIEIQGVWVLRPTEMNHAWESVDLITSL